MASGVLWMIAPPTQANCFRCQWNYFTMTAFSAILAYFCRIIFFVVFLFGCEKKIALVLRRECNFSAFNAENECKCLEKWRRKIITHKQTQERIVILPACIEPRWMEWFLLRRIQWIRPAKSRSSPLKRQNNGWIGAFRAILCVAVGPLFKSEMLDNYVSCAAWRKKHTVEKSMVKWWNGESYVGLLPLRPERTQLTSTFNKRW